MRGYRSNGRWENSRESAVRVKGTDGWLDMEQSFIGDRTYLRSFIVAQNWFTISKLLGYEAMSIQDISHRIHR